MASVAHVTVGIAAGRAFAGRSPLAWAWMAFMGALSLAPDLDVLVMNRIHVESPDDPLIQLFHRGATHSLCAAVALGALVAIVGRACGARGWRLFAAASLVVASHGLLDTLTDGGAGVELLWPFSYDRFHAPWRPIPVAPLSLVRFFTTDQGRHCALVETLATLPLIVYALWPRGRRSEDITSASAAPSRGSSAPG
jgi:inner membrane protein